MNQHKPTKLSFLDLVWRYKYSFIIYIFSISTLTFLALYLVGGVPEELKLADTGPIPDTQVVQAATQTTTVIPELKSTSSASSASTIAAANNSKGELPVKIVISKIGVNALISNPNTTNVDTLNEYLLRGAARYPGSGTLGFGNMFIFGHSTGLKIVNNQAFKTFDNLKNLNPGDTIKVYSTTKVYTYSVTSVSMVDSDAEWVDLTSTKNMLTLSTCNVFGEKQQRFVVEASFTSSQSI